MEDARTCKLCLRRFSNGHALGGHMRSHFSVGKQPPRPSSQKLDDLPLTSSFSYSGPAEAEAAPAGEGKYGLRENPRKNCRLVDPEYSSVKDYHVFLGDGDIALDGESETESSVLAAPASSSRRRSKRRRRCSAVPGNPEAEEAEPLSSVSDATQEEDAAAWLVMLSRDAWKQRTLYSKEEEDEEYQSKAAGEGQRFAGGSRRGRFRCDICNMVFRSYQALGGHRASHKKMRPSATSSPTIVDAEDDHRRHPIREIGSVSNAADPTAHECPICFRTFGSAQALGGHKRAHLSPIPSKTAATAAPPNDVSPGSSTSKSGVGFIDLNLPATMWEWDDGSQFELSAVSFAGH